MPNAGVAMCRGSVPCIEIDDMFKGTDGAAWGEVCCVDTDDISKSGMAAALGTLSLAERGEKASGMTGGVRGAVL
jgi:hypothetical protein